MFERDYINTIFFRFSDLSCSLKVMNDIEYTNRQIDISHNPLSTSTRPR